MPREMRRLDELQTAFGASLTIPLATIPDGLTPSTGVDASCRFAIYRNTFVSKLIEALRSRFPVTLRIVGDECFNELARRFITISPPRSPVLMIYGEDFPSLVETFEAELGLVYLPDVMRLELAWSRAYHAADKGVATPDQLVGLPATRLDETRVFLHPAVSVMRSLYPIVSIWTMNRDGAEPRPIEAWSAEDALVSRPDLQVRVVSLGPGQFAFIDALQRGEKLRTAAEAASVASPDFDLAASLAALVMAGIATHFHPGPRDPPGN